MEHDWQLIFGQNKINKGPYFGELLPAQSWSWPIDTWMQRRLAQIRSEQNKIPEEDL